MYALVTHGLEDLNGLAPGDESRGRGWLAPTWQEFLGRDFGPSGGGDHLALQRMQGITPFRPPRPFVDPVRDPQGEFFLSEESAHIGEWPTPESGKPHLPHESGVGR